MKEQTLSVGKGNYKHKPHSEEAKRNMRKPHKEFSEEHLEKIRNRMKDENHPRFKGNNASQEVIHKWVIKLKPKPEGCEDCGRKSRLALANLKDHKYTRNPEDYKWLCYSCHKKQDMQCSQCHKKECKLHLVCDECINWKSNFIKKLKEEINKDAFGELININNRIIDKLAGKSLI